MTQNYHEKSCEIGLIHSTKGVNSELLKQSKSDYVNFSGRKLIHLLALLTMVYTPAAIAQQGFVSEQEAEVRIERILAIANEMSAQGGTREEVEGYIQEQFAKSGIQLKKPPAFWDVYGVAQWNREMAESDGEVDTIAWKAPKTSATANIWHSNDGMQQHDRERAQGADPTRATRGPSQDSTPRSPKGGSRSVPSSRDTIPAVRAGSTEEAAQERPAPVAGLATVRTPCDWHDDVRGRFSGCRSLRDRASVSTSTRVKRLGIASLVDMANRIFNSRLT